MAGGTNDPTIEPGGSNPPPSDSSGRFERLSDALNQPMPEQIGPYRILGILGEGGMGVVYRAEQREPVRRTVALKVIKHGMDSRAVLARFEAERQALALMDHPNIARVLDAGQTDAGRPYFAMEYVAGDPINDYCDKHNLTLRQRLELFVQVCEAIQHAHQKGIIHRDIKPSNILVVVRDAQPMPKVIDFGVAKALSQRLTEKTLFTEFGQLIGTPEYMSPEQAEMSGVDIDTRSDVYSLGVLLYELLSGTLPFDRRSLRSAAYAEIQRIIREVDPPKPSTRLTSLAEADGAGVAERRRTALPKLAEELRRELELIPLKAMRKGRIERYRTAAELADDVRNYLAGRPLVAAPESVVYRTRKFVRRNRTTVSATAAAAGVVLLVTAVAFVSILRSRDRAEAARAQAEAALGEARSAVDSLLTSVSEDLLLNEPGMQPLRQKLLDAALRNWENLVRLRASDPSLSGELAAAHARIGLLAQEARSTAAGIESFRRAEALYAGLMTSETARMPAHRLARVDVLNNLGSLLERQGDSAGASASYDQAMQLAEAAAREEPTNPQATLALGQSLLVRGVALTTRAQYDEAIAALRRAADLLAQAQGSDPAARRGEVRAAGALANLGNAHLAAQRPGEAIAAYRDAVRLLRGALERDPRSLRLKADLAQVLGNLSAAAATAGQRDTAVTFSEETMALRQSLCEANPAVVRFRSDWASAMGEHARLCFAAGKSTEGAALLRRAVTEGRRAAESDAASIEILRRLLLDEAWLTEAMIDADDAAWAQQAGQAVQLAGRLAAQAGDDAQLKADTEQIASWLLLLLRRPADALAAANRGLAATPGHAGLEINLAHALVLTDGVDRAVEIYARVSATVLPGGEIAAEQIRRDIARLRQASVDSPGFDRILQSLPRPG